MTAINTFSPRNTSEENTTSNRSNSAGFLSRYPNLNVWIPATAIHPTCFNWT
jgi:hypothetical protein